MKAGVRTTEVRWNGYDHGFCLSLENEHMDPNQSPPCRDFDWRQIVNLNQLQQTAQCTLTLFVLALLASACLVTFLIKFSYLFALFFLWKDFLFRFFAFVVLFALWKFFILQINIYVEVNSMCLIAC